MPDQDLRLQQLKVWLDEQLPGLFTTQGWGVVPPATLTAASSDASFRRYFRWEGGGRSFVVMDAPPPGKLQTFRRYRSFTRSIGNKCSENLCARSASRLSFAERPGEKTYLDVITAENADQLFADAIDALLAFQQLPMEAPLPSYDVALLRRELELFPEWYVRRELGIEFDARQLGLWQRVSEHLIDSALAQPKVLVHRDYMPRNLMISEPNPGVLDFQDAVYGPVTYDITCLFKDAFLSWPQARVREWQRGYWQRAGALGIPVQADFEEFLRASDLMGVQRHLKVIGIFARICHRDGKPRYLADVPRFFAYIEAVLADRPELSELGELLASLRVEAVV